MGAGGEGFRIRSSRMTTSRRLPLLAGLAVLLLAALLRAPSLTAGMPYINYVDEGNFLHPVAAMLRKGDWDPRTYMYPQLPLTMAAVAGRLYAPFHPSLHEGRTFREDLSEGRRVYDVLEPFEFLFAARCMSFLASLGVVILTGLYGRRLLGAPAGLFALFLAAWLPPLVIRGGSATVDPWAALFSLACFFFVDRLRASGHPRESFLAGAMAGLAFASKYPAVLVACGAGLTLLLAERPFRDKLRWLAPGVAGILAGLIVGMPALVLHPQDVARDLQAQNHLYTHLKPTPRLWEQAILRAEWDLPYDHPELGIPFLLLAAAGAVAALRDRRLARTVAGWLLFIGVSLALYVPKSFQPFRNLLPHMPLLCLLVAILYARIRQRLARPVWADAGAVLVVLALFGGPVARWAWQRAESTDSRRQAMDWVIEHTGREDSVLVLRELAFVRSELRRPEGTVVLRRLPGALVAIRGRRPEYLVVGRLDREGAGPVDLAQHPAVLRGYVLRARFGAVTTSRYPGIWKGNHQLVYVLERKEGRRKGQGGGGPHPRPLSQGERGEQQKMPSPCSPLPLGEGPGMRALAGDGHGGRGADRVRSRVLRPAAGARGRLLEVLVAAVGEDEAASLDRVDHRPGARLGQRRAAPAPPEPSLAAGMLGTDVPGAVHHDIARLGAVVDPLVQPLELERVAVAPHIGPAGLEQPEARLVAVVQIGEPGGVVVATAPAVRHELVVEHLALGQVEHPESRLGRRQGIIDDRQQVVPAGHAAGAGTGDRIERHREDLRGEPLGTLGDGQGGLGGHRRGGDGRGGRSSRNHSWGRGSRSGNGRRSSNSRCRRNGLGLRRRGDLGLRAGSDERNEEREEDGWSQSSLEHYARMASTGQSDQGVNCRSCWTGCGQQCSRSITHLGETSFPRNALKTG